jgi:hypothetical protein
MDIRQDDVALLTMNLKRTPNECAKAIDSWKNSSRKAQTRLDFFSHLPLNRTHARKMSIIRPSMSSMIQQQEKRKERFLVSLPESPQIEPFIVLKSILDLIASSRQ